jgi:hypothetical protein
VQGEKGVSNDFVTVAPEDTTHSHRNSPKPQDNSCPGLHLTDNLKVPKEPE